MFLYGEPINERGFVFMDSPGFDPTSVTGLVASGANVVAFTTGRGSCFGCKPVHTGYWSVVSPDLVSAICSIA